MTKKKNGASSPSIRPMPVFSRTGTRAWRSAAASRTGESTTSRDGSWNMTTFFGGPTGTGGSGPGPRPVKASRCCWTGRPWRSSRPITGGAMCRSGWRGTRQTIWESCSDFWPISPRRYATALAWGRGPGTGTCSWRPERTLSSIMCWIRRKRCMMV